MIFTFRSKAFKLLSVFVILMLLLVAEEASSASTLIGRVTLVKRDGQAYTLPVTSGTKLGYDQKVLMRVRGASFVIEKGSELKVLEESEVLALQVSKGVIHFRVKPSKRALSFNTREGDFRTLGIAKASASRVRGTIRINRSGIELWVNEGSMEAVTEKGIETVEAGEKLEALSR